MVKKWIKQLFCRHQYKTISDEVYNVMSPDGILITGTVEIECVECHKCLKSKLFVKNRTYYK